MPVEARSGQPLASPCGPATTVCIGYTASLPEVLEAGRALSWRKEGQLKDFYDGEPIPQLAKDCIDILDTELQRVQAYAMDKTSQ